MTIANVLANAATRNARLAASAHTPPVKRSEPGRSMIKEKNGAVSKHLLEKLKELKN